MNHHDESDEEDRSDHELPDESDIDDSDDPELIECPSCGKMIGEEAERCHHCGSYVLEGRARPRVPYWLVAIVLVLIALAVIWGVR